MAMSAAPAASATATLRSVGKGAHESSAEQRLILPGSLQPYSKATIYARVNSYLKSWNKDIGAPVKAGEVLASIEAPDLDQQLAQARATLASAKANHDIAAITAERNKTLVKKQVVPRPTQDVARHAG
jgi:multidrug efflux pump subunit AcrA (membrane-fusion protein)